MFIYFSKSKGTYTNSNIEWKHWTDIDSIVNLYTNCSINDVKEMLAIDINSGVYKRVMNYPSKIKVTGFMSYRTKARSMPRKLLFND